jgi:hypothetical protein
MAESKKSTPKKSPGVFDISHPGKGGIAASSTSRPVIIKHQLMPDPMVNTDRQPDLPVVLPSKAATKVRIAPLHDDIDADGIQDPPKAAKEVPEPVPNVVVADKPEVKITSETKIADVAPEPDTSGIPESPDEREADNRMAREKAAKLQRMIDNEEYFLPIETLEERRSRKVAIFGVILIVVLAIAWYNVALDAGLLENTYNLPHTTFFTVK